MIFIGLCTSTDTLALPLSCAAGAVAAKRDISLPDLLSFIVVAVKYLWPSLRRSLTRVGRRTVETR